MKYFLKTFLTILAISLVASSFASESRISGMSTPYWATEDVFGFIFQGSYVNSEYSFIDLEPNIPLNQTYGLAKVSLPLPFLPLNIGVILNFPYPTLALIDDIAILPAGWTLVGTPLQNFTIADHLRNRIDLVLGTGKLIFLPIISPYIGFGYASDFAESSTENQSSKLTTSSIQSISEFKIILGSEINLGFISLNPDIRLYLPSAENSSITSDANVQNYQNSRIHKGSGFGFAGNLYGNLGDKKSELRFAIGYSYYPISSKQETKIDLNGNGDLNEAGEENTQITHDIGSSAISVGVSYNQSIVQNITLIIGASYVSGSVNNKWIATGTANVTGTNDLEYTSDNSVVNIPTFIAAEITPTEWITLRSGLEINTYQLSYSFTKDGKEGQAIINRSSSFGFPVIFNIGFSLKPFKDFSLDWVLSATFINNVLQNGRLPYIISGNNQFDAFSQNFSIEYKF